MRSAFARSPISSKRRSSTRRRYISRSFRIFWKQTGSRARSCSGSPEVEDAVIAKELSESVGRFLDTLPPETRKLFLRRYFFLESAEEIAQMYAMRPGTVTVALHRTRKKLREHLKREGFFDE